MTAVAFTDVERNYNQAKECLVLNTLGVLNVNTPNMPTWYEHRKMVVWLHVSCKEFIKNYNKVSASFLEQSAGDDIIEKKMIKEHIISLSNLYSNFRYLKGSYLAGVAE